MKKTLSLLVWLAIFSSPTFSKDSLNVRDQITISLLEERVKNLQKQLETFEVHTKELQNAKKEEIEKLMNQKGDALDRRMALYSGFFVVLLTIAAWVLNWFGKNEISKVVNRIIGEKIEKELSIKFSNEVIQVKLTEWGEPAIRKIVQELTEISDKAKKEYELLKAELKRKKDDIDIAKTTTEEQQKVKKFNKVLDKVKREEDFTEDDWFWKGVEARNEKRYDLALEFITKAISLNQSIDNYYITRGVCYDELGKYEKSIQDYDQAIQINPKNDIPWNNRGLAKNYIGKYQEAIKDLDEATRLNPGHDVAWNNRGLAKDNLGNHEEAIQDYTEAIRLNPHKDKTWNNRGASKNDLGRYEEAIKDLNESIRLNPNFPNPFRHRALSHFKLKNLDQALKDIDTAIELKSDYKEAIDLKEQILKAK